MFFCCTPEPKTLGKDFVDANVRTSTLSLATRAIVEKKHSNDINKRLLTDEKEFRKQKENTKKVLLLGTSSAGKTTVLKQMKLKWRDCGLNSERESYSRSVRENLVGSLKRIIGAFPQLKLNFDQEIKEHVDWFITIQHDTDIVQKHHVRLIEIVPLFMANAAFQQALSRGSEYNLFDSAKYFLENSKRILEDDYVPTDDDILRVRNTTFREEETRFENIDGPRHIVVFDVGGRKGQRKKWVHFFDDVDVILFISSLSSFDQQMEENSEKNQMMDSLETFEVIINSQFLKQIPIMLFMNKIDLFREKIKTRKIKDYFPDYHGKEHDYDDGVNYFKNLFQAVIDNEERDRLSRTKSSGGARRALNIFETHATDQKQMGKFIAGVKDAVLQAAIGDMFQS